MPCDTYAAVASDEFVETVNILHRLIESSSAKTVIVGGDMNIDVSRKTGNVQYFKDFVSECMLNFTWDFDSAEPYHTYESYDGASVSVIDHVLVTDGIFNSVCKTFVDASPSNVSNHFPVIVEFNLDKPETFCQVVHRLDSVSWQRATEADLKAYKSAADRNLRRLTVPQEVLKCKDYKCTSDSHRNSIDNFCNDVIDCLINAAQETIPKRKAKKCHKPQWTELVQPERERALLWHSIWCGSGRPRHGVIADIRRSTRALYHKAIRTLAKQDHKLKLEHIWHTVFLFQ